MSKLSKILVALLILDLVFVNIGFIFLYFKPATVSVPIITSPTLVNTTTSIPTLVPSDTPIPSIAPKKQTIPSKTVSYVPLPGSGSLLSHTWADLPGTDFYFDTADFPNLKEAYFEANLKLFNGNGLGFLRLFDITSGIEVWGSEVKTNSQAGATIVSGKLTLRQGKHLIRVQAKSLTADTTVYISGRLKLITEN